MIEKLHKELREMYLKYGMENEVTHESFQAALDDALSKGNGATINLTSYTGSAVVRGLGEKTLLPKPHPERCPCPKCPQDPPPPEGVHLLPPGRLRVSDELKNTYLERLQEAFTEGMLSAPELDARQNAVLAAATEEELRLLLRDLPAGKQPAVVIPPAEEKYFSGKKGVFLFVASLVSVTFPVMGGIGVLGGGSAGMSAVMALIGGLAALLLVILGRSSAERLDGDRPDR
jgi:hypothetical protein